MNDQVCIAWSDLTLFRSSLLSSKVVLNSISGYANFGTITAVMGPSGSGLTSLLIALNGFKGFSDRYLDQKTKIFLNQNTKIDSIFIDHNEKDYLIMGLTVKQNLIYSSKLKNSSISGNISHELNVQKVLSELMIVDIADNTTADCSGGELKRVAIAQELTALNKPNLILIDEPTTGLDSHIASVVSYKIIYYARLMLGLSC